MDDNECSNYQIKNYKAYFKNRIKINPNKPNYGGIALYAKNTLDVNYINLNIDSCESSGIITNINNRDTLILIIYRTGKNFNQFFDSLLKELTNYKKYDLIFLGDYNVNILKDDINSKKLLDTFAKLHCKPLIKTCTRPNSNSCIDHIFTNIIKTQTYSGTLNLSFSDHLATYIHIGDSKLKNKPENNFSMFNWKKYNKEKTSFINRLSENINNINMNNDIDVCTEKFYEIIRNTTKRYFHYANDQTKKFTQPWMNNDIYNSIKQRDHLSKKYLKNPTTENQTNFKNFRNQVKTEIRKSKVEYCNKLINNSSNTKEVWSGINNILLKTTSKATIPKKIISNNKEITEPNKILNALNEHFSTIANKLDKNIPNLQKNTYNQTTKQNAKSKIPTQEQFRFKKINPTQLKSVLKNNHFKLDPNGIPGTLYKDMNDIYINFATKIFNKAITEGKFPNILKTAKVTPIFKKGDKTNPNNYRPISMLYGLSKIIETIIKEQLLNFLEKTKFLSDNQHGFRKKHSTNSAILSLIEYIRKNNDLGYHVLALFLDLNKAFDTVNHKLLIQKLEKIGIKDLELNLFKSYLSNRKQYIEINNTKTNSLPLTHGVPQGSVLGPILFLIYVNDLYDITENFTDSSSTLFADDTVLLFRNKNKESLCAMGTNGFEKVFIYLTENRLSLNMSKTNFIIFSNTSNQPYNKLYTKFGTLDRVENIKYLGITIQENLKFSLHINEIVNKLNTANNIIFILRQYLSKQTLLKIYYALAYPHLIYCISCWAITFKTELNRIKVAQNNILRTILFKKKLDHTRNTWLYNDLKLQNLDQTIATRMLIDYVQYSKESLSHPYNTRNKTMSNVFMHYYKTNKGKKTFSNTAAKLYNTLPIDLKTLENKPIYKSKIKTYINNIKANKLQNLLYD